MRWNNGDAARPSASVESTRQAPGSIWRILAKGSAATAAICAGGNFAADAQASIIYMDTPLQPSSNWDVDGDSVAEFYARRRSRRTSTYGSSSTLIGDYLLIHGSIRSRFGGMGWLKSNVPRGPRVHNLTHGQTIGPSPQPQYAWDAPGDNWLFTYYVNYLGSRRTTSDIAPGFVDGEDGFAGFRFENPDGIHYGWARLNIDLTGKTFTIKEWAYNDDPQEPIRAGQTQVPEPGSGALAGLGVLAAGAAGVRRWRRKRNDDIS